MDIDSENHLFRILPSEIKHKIESGVYKRRQRKLFPSLEAIRKKMVDQFNEIEDCFIADCMPLEVCKLPRGTRSKIRKEEVYGKQPSKRILRSQKTENALL